jgi:hypothetical protein
VVVRLGSVEVPLELSVRGFDVEANGALSPRTSAHRDPHTLSISRSCACSSASANACRGRSFDICTANDSKAFHDDDDASSAGVPIVRTSEVLDNGGDSSTLGRSPAVLRRSRREFNGATRYRKDYRAVPRPTREREPAGGQTPKNSPCRSCAAHRLPSVDKPRHIANPSAAAPRPSATRAEGGNGFARSVTGASTGRAR